MSGRYEIDHVPNASPKSFQYWRQQHPAVPGFHRPVRVLPAVVIDVVINRGDAFTVEDRRGRSALPAVHLVGPLTRSIQVRATGTTDLTVIRLQPWLLGALCRVPLSELTNSIVAASELGLEGPLSSANLPKYLWEKLASVTPDQTVLAALERIEATGGQEDISTLADSLGVGARYLRRRFRHQIGFGPKTAASIVRCQRALWLLRQSVRPPEVALEAGFVDQAHLTKALRQVIGTTPGDIRRFRPTSLHDRFNETRSGIYKTVYL